MDEPNDSQLQNVETAPAPHATPTLPLGIATGILTGTALVVGALIWFFPVVPSPRLPYHEIAPEELPETSASHQEATERERVGSITDPLNVLTANSNGHLLLKKVSNYSEQEEIVSVLLKNPSTGEEELLTSFVNFPYAADVIVSGGKLYFSTDRYAWIGPNNQIMEVDLFTGAHRKLPLPYNASKPVHSFFVRAGEVYYLEGEFCNEYMAGCSGMDLKKFSLASGSADFLVGSSTSREIDGFSPDGKKLILSYVEGDAGCGWGSYESFDLITKNLLSLGKYSACEGDPVDPDQTLLFEKAQTDSKWVYHLIVKNGKIIIPAVSEPFRYAVDIMVTTAEYPLE